MFLPENIVLQLLLLLMQLRHVEVVQHTWLQVGQNQVFQEERTGEIMVLRSMLFVVWMDIIHELLRIHLAGNHREIMESSYLMDLALRDRIEERIIMLLEE